MPPRSPWHLIPAGCVLTATLGASACSSLATQPAGTTAALAGNWQLDVTESDDFDRKLGPLLEAQRERMRPRHNQVIAPGSRGGSDGDPSGAGRGPNELDALMMPPEEPGKIRERLAGELRPPAKLQIALSADTVAITGDADPARQFHPGQSVSRIDSTGAASLSSGWDQSAFVVHAKYTNHGSRGWRYELEPGGSVLRLSFEAEDPEFGSFKLQTHYRRATGAGLN